MATTGGGAARQISITSGQRAANGHAPRAPA
jgi:hypothetical protein